MEYIKYREGEKFCSPLLHIISNSRSRQLVEECFHEDDVQNSANNLYVSYSYSYKALGFLCIRDLLHRFMYLIRINY